MGEQQSYIHTSIVPRHTTVKRWANTAMYEPIRGQSILPTTLAIILYYIRERGQDRPKAPRSITTARRKQAVVYEYLIVLPLTELYTEINGIYLFVVVHLFCELLSVLPWSNKSIVFIGRCVVFVGIHFRWNGRDIWWNEWDEMGWWSSTQSTKEFLRSNLFLYCYIFVLFIILLELDLFFTH